MPQRKPTRVDSFLIWLLRKHNLFANKLPLIVGVLGFVFACISLIIAGLSKQPGWVAITLYVLGALGVIAGVVLAVPLTLLLFRRSRLEKYLATRFREATSSEELQRLLRARDPDWAERRLLAVHAQWYYPRILASLERLPSSNSERE